MRVNAEFTLVGKKETKWFDENKVERTSRKGNFSQDNGEIIGSIALTEEQFNTLVAGRVYTASAIYGTGSNGGYLKITNIVEKK